MTASFRRVAVLGTGLIGGSFARALRKHFHDAAVVGWDKEQVLRHALERGAIHEAIPIPIYNSAEKSPSGIPPAVRMPGGGVFYGQDRLGAGSQGRVAHHRGDGYEVEVGGRDGVHDARSTQRVGQLDRRHRPVSGEAVDVRVAGRRRGLPE